MSGYFPGNYWWSAMVMNSLGMGGGISEIDRFCGSLKQLAGARGLLGPDDEATGNPAATVDIGLSNRTRGKRST